MEKNWTSVQLFFFSSMLFENTFENTYWQKIKQLQPMWLQLISRRGFEKTFENFPRRNAKKCPHFNYSSSGACNLRMHLKTYRGEKLNKCNQCDYASFCDMFSSLTHLFWCLCHVLNEHLEIHSGEKPNKCNQCDFASSYASVLRRRIWKHTVKKSQTNATIVTLHPHKQTI